MKLGCKALMISGLLMALYSGLAFTSQEREPYLLRLALTLDRQSAYAATLGRQASMAVPGGGTGNPAAGIWSITADSSKASAVATYVEARSESGAHIVAAPVSYAAHVEGYGRLYGAYAHTITIDNSGESGHDQGLTSDEFWLGYSERLSGRASYGLLFKYTHADIINEFDSALLFGHAARLDVSQDSYDLSAGLLIRLDEKWWLGASANAGWGEAITDIRNVDLILVPIPAPPYTMVLSPKTLLDTTESVVKSASARAGIGYQLNNYIGVYCDLNYMNVDAEDAGSVNITRMSLGSEIRRQEVRYRAGVTADTKKQIVYSLGLGKKIGDLMIMELGYQRNSAPEVKPEFGRVDVFSLSITMEI